MVAIAAGTHHNLALHSDGTVTAWGRNTDSQSTVPVDLDPVLVRGDNVITDADGGTNDVTLSGADKKFFEVNVNATIDLALEISKNKKIKRYFYHFTGI